MSPNAWTEGVFPLLGGVEDKYKQKKRLILKTKLRLSFCPKHYDSLFTYQENYMKDVKRSEIYFANLDPVIGREQGGTRPVLIIQNDVGNEHSDTIIVAAITSSQTKAEFPTHVWLHTEFLEKDSIVKLEQIRTIDKCRLSDCVGKVGKKTMRKVNRAIAISLGIDNRRNNGNEKNSHIHEGGK